MVAGKTPKLPPIPEEERTPLVMLLLEIIQQQREEIQALRDEVARLKGQKPKPQIRPSQLQQVDDPALRGLQPKRPGSAKRMKTAELEIHATTTIAATGVPKGSRFKGFKEYTVQDILLQPHNTRYRLERWQAPDGTYIVGELPSGVHEGHFGSTLVCFILYQHYHALVTEPLLLEQLQEIGVSISSGELSNILIRGKERYHAEKDAILRVGLQMARHLHVDDTGARHKGKNGFCTHIGNQVFAWFESTSSKSRVNFLELLRGGERDYLLSEDALGYMRSEKMPKGILGAITTRLGQRFENKQQWEESLQAWGIRDERCVRLATEGALLGSVLNHGINPGLVIVSDDAGQFNVLRHALCWIHAERLVAKLVGFNDSQRAALEDVRAQIWEFYEELKSFKRYPLPQRKPRLERMFDRIFTQKTCFQTLNKLLKRIHRNKAELLLVLEQPDIPLHNNESERDIREYVKRRKISGSTRSDLGRRCRDTFASLKKTCRKLGISFWHYLKDRVTGSHTVAPLPDMVRQRLAEATQ